MSDVLAVLDLNATEYAELITDTITLLDDQGTEKYVIPEADLRSICKVKIV